MSAREIISELPKLNLIELRQVDTCLHELLGTKDSNPILPWRISLLEAGGPALTLREPAPEETAGALLDYLEKNCLGLPLINPACRAALRSGRGRRSNRPR